MVVSKELLDPNKDSNRPDTVSGSLWEDISSCHSNGKEWIREPVVELCVWWTE